ncbi:hypothetical protein C9E85_15915 [Plesiomonas shigelloides]|uniref:EexN family lipoprotein n=1 Tax=Plesiomonas shigelloides TaxID=703 RepID=UPI000D578381|nr:EexN family lipoprotein [Plesiomonas shigelloides]MCX2497704.1 EexN family lipoprotein [Plesiomonas shigelloides]PVU64867.1 hypothetical protein C9E85_15915 [Plesiomonas shigelloides]
MKKIILLIPLFLAACDSAYTETDFLENKELMEKWVIKCEKASDPSDAVIENCRHLQKAQMKVFLGSLDELKNQKIKIK